ncbi:winged helix-turn-helix domain-containing protein [Sphaerisporangium flaviroseum]|uniref:Winged helix-turn-helix domain-containing protein n=2 Tax=Sphaerisporangium flaviroseum TaxID=509199 RepID=A0ABP7HVZ3_9ACTN
MHDVSVSAEVWVTDDGAMTIPVARLAKLLADDTRATFCTALLDGRAWTAGELAHHAGVAASTATAHLSLLVEGGLLTEERQGRHRYVRLAGPHAAQLLEDLAAYSADPLPTPRTLRAHNANQALVFARTCYDHLAGRLGVAVTDALTSKGLLRQDTGFALTDEGKTWFGTVLSIDLTAPSRRPMARACLDWTERRTHLAGTSGAALCRTLLNRDWLVRVGSTRALRLTPAGEQAMAEVFGMSELERTGRPPSSAC